MRLKLAVPLLAALAALPWLGTAPAAAQAPRARVGIVVPTPYGFVVVDTPPPGRPERSREAERPRERDRQPEARPPASEPRPRARSEEPRRQALPAERPKSLGEPQLRRRKP
jgi:hypothetical protein